MNNKSRLYTVLALFLVAGSLAITQESSEYDITTEEVHDETEILSQIFENDNEPEIDVEPLPDWVTPARWYRSNLGGMKLEEIPSRLAAMRNEYALVSDFINKDELPELLLPYYKDHYIEIRVLYRNGKEARRQWIFRDENSLYRLVAVFREIEPEEEFVDFIILDNDVVEELIHYIEEENLEDHEDITIAEIIEEKIAEAAADDNAVVNDSEEEVIDEDVSLEHRVFTARSPSGFIEIYGDNFLLERELVFTGDDEVRDTLYIYNKGTLIRTEALRNTYGSGSENAQKIYTDYYRYNRSGSLRSIERIYHERLDAEKSRLTFAHRVLDAAVNSMFLTDQLYLSSDFFDDFSVDPDHKMIFSTDDRHRILSQSLVDSDGEVIWVIKNTWTGDRISSALKIEGDEQRLNEYDYNSKGDLVAERNILNGIIQRQVFINGNVETEDLYMNGIVVLRAIWEDGRKISEQRVRPGDNNQ